jgi:hypothetical protein
MLRYGLGLGANFCMYTMLLSLSCYKLAYHYFLHLWSTLCTHTCSEDEEFFNEDYF